MCDAVVAPTECRGDSMTLRRGFVIAGLALVLGASPAAGQSSSRIPRIGYMSADSGPNPLSEALLRGLSERGWVEGQSIVIEYRWAAGRPDRYPVLAAELVGLRVDLIVAGGGTPGALAAQRATSVIPIVTPITGDPVGAGLVTSLARPGGNVTGLSMQDTEISAKRLELLREALPKLARVAILRDPAGPTAGVAATEAAARSLGLTGHVVTARRPEDFESALDAAKRARADALIVLASSVFNTQRMRLVNLVARQRLPAMYEHRLFVVDGGLMSYGPDPVDLNRRAAVYVDKILKGAKPGELPIEQPTKFDLVINLKAANALGVTLPPAVLARATEVVR
jgi:putative tryptophan/tyrosine transport system substrate-binding protein